MKKLGNKKEKKILLLLCVVMAIVVGALSVAVIGDVKKSKSGTESADEKGKDAEGEEGSADGASGSSIALPSTGIGSDAEGEVGPDGLQFPIQVENSNIEILKILPYSGNYLEDGSDADISGVATIIIRNNGKTAVEYVDLILDRDGTKLQFTASAVPSGGTVVVQEKNKQSYNKGTYQGCSAKVAEVQKLGMSSKKVEVKEEGDQSLVVTNLTDQEIPAVRVFYKFHMEEEGVYVGGITYNVKLTSLKAGESQTVTPSHYLKDASEVVMVRTYDTAE